MTIVFILSGLFYGRLSCVILAASYAGGWYTVYTVDEFTALHFNYHLQVVRISNFTTAYSYLSI